MILNSIMIRSIFHTKSSTSQWKYRSQTEAADALEEAGDVIAAAGRPDEGVSLYGDVGSHEFSGLLTAHPTCIANTIMIHPKPERERWMTLWNYKNGIPWSWLQHVKIHQTYQHLTQTYVILHTVKHMPPCLDSPSAQSHMAISSKVPGWTIRTRPLMTSPPMITAPRPMSVAKARVYWVTKYKQSSDPYNERKKMLFNY